MTYTDVISIEGNEANGEITRRRPSRLAPEAQTVAHIKDDDLGIVVVESNANIFVEEGIGVTNGVVRFKQEAPTHVLVASFTKKPITLARNKVFGRASLERTPEVSTCMAVEEVLGINLPNSEVNPEMMSP